MSMGTEVLFLFFGVNQPGHETDHSSPSSSEVKEEWSCTTTPLICFHGVYRGKWTSCWWMMKWTVKWQYRTALKFMYNFLYFGMSGKEYLQQCFQTFFLHTAVAIQNMYTYHRHNTILHVHVPLSQYKECRHTTVTIQKMFTYNCHNTKHQHVPMSGWKTCTRTTVTIQGM